MPWPRPESSISYHYIVNVMNVNHTEEVKSNSLFDDLVIDILGQGGCLKFYAHGNSMIPLIRNGDIILVDPKKNDFRTGNIIFYRRSAGRYIAHRLMHVNRNNGSLELETKGDGVQEFDRPVPLEQVMGRVVIIESRGRELRADGRLGRVINRLLAYSSRMSCRTGNLMQRVLVKLWCLLSKKCTAPDGQRSTMVKGVV
jgi:signal peptidase I